MRYQKERTKAAATLLLCYNAGGCRQLTLHECDIESIYWLKTNLSIVTDQESKLFPKLPPKQRKLALGGTQAFHTIPDGNDLDLPSSKLEERDLIEKVPFFTSNQHTLSSLWVYLHQYMGLY